MKRGKTHQRKEGARWQDKRDEHRKERKKCEMEKWINYKSKKRDKEGGMKQGKR